MILPENGFDTPDLGKIIYGQNDCRWMSITPLRSRERNY